MNYFDYMQSGYVCRDQSESSEKETTGSKRRCSRAFVPAVHVASRHVAINILVATTSIRPDAPGFRLAPKQQTMTRSDETGINIRKWTTRGRLALSLSLPPRV